MSKKKKIIILTIAAVTAAVIIVAGVTGSVLGNKVRVPNHDINVDVFGPDVNIAYDLYQGEGKLTPGLIPTVELSSESANDLFLHLGGVAFVYIGVQPGSDGRKFDLQFKQFYQADEFKGVQLKKFRAIADFYDSDGDSLPALAEKNYSSEAKFSKKTKLNAVVRIEIAVTIETIDGVTRECVLRYNVA